MSKKAKAGPVFIQFVIAVTLFLAMRWALFEAYVIPSGSMIPSLLVNDHIFVTKFDFGLRIPFTEIWITEQQLPKRGDVIVFKEKNKGDYFMIKRVIGLPGDQIVVHEDGELWINKEKIPRTQISEEVDQGILVYEENLFGSKHKTYQSKNGLGRTADLVVPEDQIFLMGDNRDASSDSRYWGPLPKENLMGKARVIWLACSKTLSKVEFICDPSYIHWRRLFSRIE